MPPPRPRPQVKLASYETYGGAAEVRSVVAAVWNAGYSGATDDVQDDVALLLLNKPSTVAPVAIAPGECVCVCVHVCAAVCVCLSTWAAAVVIEDAIH